MGVFTKYKQQISEENRMFQNNWKEIYFIEPNKTNLAIYIYRHYTTKYKYFYENGSRK